MNRWGQSLSETRGSINFEDHKNIIDPNVFNGVGGSIGASILVGKGLSIGKIRLGDAFSRPSDGDTKGLDVGATVTIGSSTVTSIQIEKCSCEE